MKKKIISLCVALLSLVHPAVAVSSPVVRPGQTLTGRIKKFECGDNCYLTITTPGGDVNALCSARACTPWFENQKMPARMIGRKVMVKTGMGKQFDGAGDVAGHYPAFEIITFIK